MLGVGHGLDFGLAACGFGLADALPGLIGARAHTHGDTPFNRKPPGKSILANKYHWTDWNSGA